MKSRDKEGVYLSVLEAVVTVGKIKEERKHERYNPIQFSHSRSSIAYRANLRCQDSNRTVDKLVDLGIVRKINTNALDKWGTEFQLTDKGIKCLSRLRKLKKMLPL